MSSVQCEIRPLTTEELMRRHRYPMAGVRQAEESGVVTPARRPEDPRPSDWSLHRPRPSPPRNGQRVILLGTLTTCQPHPSQMQGPRRRLKEPHPTSPR
jgi:hypothetical protein